MQGSIGKYTTKGSSKPHWRYRIYLGKDAGGKKLYDARAGFAKQAQASEAMRRRIEELRDRASEPVPAPDRHKTFGEWLQTWLDTYATDRCQPKTLERYRQLADYATKRPDGEPSAVAQILLPDLKQPT